jgi:hypothetical protein
LSAEPTFYGSDVLKRRLTIRTISYIASTVLSGRLANNAAVKSLNAPG